MAYSHYEFFKKEAPKLLEDYEVEILRIPTIFTCPTFPDDDGWNFQINTNLDAEKAFKIFSNLPSIGFKLFIPPIYERPFVNGVKVEPERYVMMWKDSNKISKQCWLYENQKLHNPVEEALLKKFWTNS